MFLDAYLYVDFALYFRSHHWHKILVLIYLQEKIPYHFFIFFFDLQTQLIKLVRWPVQYSFVS